MGFKLGAIVGFGAGYYLGARAGRERYDQMNKLIDKAKRTDAYDTATTKAKDLASQGVGKAKDLAAEKAEQAKDRFGDDEPTVESHLPTHGISNN